MPFLASARAALLAPALLGPAIACGPARTAPQAPAIAPAPAPTKAPTPTPEDASMYATRREAMVRHQIAARGIDDERVLAAMRAVPRHLFVPEGQRDQAYEDHPLPIGWGQTISQPYIVALMTALVAPSPDKRALDVGTGSGYQAAVLAELVRSVHSIEIVCELADQARARLARLGYDNVTVRCGDGYAGWEEEAPFDIIVVAAAPKAIPPPLIDQLAVGGRLVIPVGEGSQDLVLVEKRPDGTVEQTTVTAVRFVPMTGRARQP